MKKNTDIELIPFDFDGGSVRRTVHPETGEVMFSVVDVVGVLTESSHPKRYWTDMKSRENQLYEICVQLKLRADDGKMRLTDVANLEGIFRIIQSIPSKAEKVERFKRELARVGVERVQENIDPSKAIDRGISTFEKQGKSKEWAIKRAQTIEANKEFRDELYKRGCREDHKHNRYEISTATNDVYRGYTGEKAQFWREKLGVDNIRNNMTSTGLALSLIAEVTAVEDMRIRNIKGFGECRVSAKKGGEVAKKTAEAIKEVTGYAPALFETKSLNGETKRYLAGGVEECLSLPC